MGILDAYDYIHVKKLLLQYLPTPLLNGFIITELDSFEDSNLPLMIPASTLLHLQKIWIQNVN